MVADSPLIREGLRPSAFLLDRMGSDLQDHSASIGALGRGPIPAGLGFLFLA
jgi:hypothetical protein